MTPKSRQSELQYPLQEPDTTASLESRVAILTDLLTPCWVFDIDNSSVAWSNKAGLEVWNAESQSELQNRDMSADMSPAVTRRLKQYQEDFITGQTFTEFWTLYPKGNPVTYFMHYSGVTLDDGRLGMLVEATSEDRENDSATLRSAQALMHTSVMITMYNDSFDLVYCNPAARAVINGNTQSLKEHLVNDGDWESVVNALEAQAEYTAEFLVNTAKGEAWHQLNFQRSPDSTTGRVTLLVSEVDITMRRVAEERAHSLAYLDTLTGLPNRTLLNEALDREITFARTSNKRLAVLFIDLDRFKIINDSLGHGVGDELLKKASQVLKNKVRSTDTIARLGGDEFLVLMPGITDTSTAHEMATRLLESVGVPFTLGSHELRVSSSIGISIFPDDGGNGETLIKHADIAMYSAKEAGGDCVTRFNPGMMQDLKKRLQLDVDLRRAIERQEFELYYQPRVSADSGDIIGVEALIRWFHPERGLINPADFISVAEETGMIVEIGHWVLDEAVRQCAEWNNLGMSLSVSVNVSSRQFNSTQLAEQVLNALAKSNCPAYLLELEITESMLVRETTNVLQTLNELRDTGVKISVDDFGTGYSSLSYLKDFPLNKLKIDRTFIMNEDQKALVEMIVSLGKMLKLGLVAEGIESSEQRDWLSALGCDEFQGYYFSKPLPAKDFLIYFQKHTDTREALATLH